MGQLARRDVTAALRFLRDASAAADGVARFVQFGVESLPRLVGSELSTMSYCDLESGRRRVRSNPPNAISASDLQCFDHFFYDHPLVRYHAGHPNGASRKITDAMSQHRFRNTALYNEYYRRIGIDYVIALPLYVDRRALVSFVLNRSRSDFSERDRQVLDLIRQQLAFLYRNAAALERAQLAAGQLTELMLAEGWSLVALDAQGRVRSLSRGAGALIGGWCPHARLRVGITLPERFDRWLRPALDPTDTAFSFTAPLELHEVDRRLIAYLLPDPDHHGGFLVLLEETAIAGAESFTSWLLTRREREVLAWVAAGKTNQEIGAILVASPRTVQKHLEHIFTKLGVETRTAAVMRAMSVAPSGAVTRNPSARPS